MGCPTDSASCGSNPEISRSNALGLPKWRNPSQKRTQATGVEPSSTYSQSCSSIRIMYRHTIPAVRERDAHTKADKAVHRLQLTTRSQNPSTFSYVKGGFACTGRSRKKRHSRPRPHGARKQGKGALSIRNEVAKGVRLPSPEGASEKDFVRLE